MAKLDSTIGSSNEPLIARKFKGLIWHVFISYGDARRSVLLEWPPYDEEVRGSHLARIYHTLGTTSLFPRCFYLFSQTSGKETNERTSFLARETRNRSPMCLKVRCRTSQVSSSHPCDIRVIKLLDISATFFARNVLGHFRKFFLICFFKFNFTY